MRAAALVAIIAITLSPAYGTQDRTITKVVKLLQEMLDKSKDDGETDTELFAKYKCYCDTNTADKKKTITDDTATIALLEGEIAELQASNTKLSVENAELEMAMGDNERARTTAESLRTKALADFQNEELDMTNAIGSMTQAIETLAAIGADQTSAVSADHEKFMAAGAVTAAGGASLLKLSTDVKGALKAASVFLNQKQKTALSSFIQAPFTGTYTAQSGEIVGILKNMKDTFKSNLASARAAENTSAEANDKFIEVKTDEYNKMNTAYDEKDATLGTNDGSLSTKKDQHTVAAESKAAAEDFLGKLITMCTDKTKEYEDRKMMRANEEAAIAQAVSILNSDAAFENFGENDATSSGATGFIQLSRHTKRMSVREQVQMSLARAAQQHKSLRLARISVSLEEGNPFDKVIEEVEAMIDLIAKEETADDEQKAWCDSEREESHSQKSAKETNINTLDGQIDTLVDTLDSEVDGLRKQLSDEQATLEQNLNDQKEEIADRSEANAVYQKSIGNLVQSGKTLKSAIDVLQKFYDWLHAKQGPHHYDTKSGKDSGGSNIKRIPESSVADLEEACSADPACVGFNTEGWLKSAIVEDAKLYDSSGDLHVKVYDSTNPVLMQRQTRNSEDPAPPATFDSEADTDGAYAGQTEQGSSALNMLNFILSETRAEENTAHENEESSQHSFEDAMTDYKSAQTQSEDIIATLEESIAEKEKELQQAKEDLEKTTNEKVALEKYLLKIKPGCDFITDNISVRKDNRVAETDALNGALDKLRATPAYQAAAAAAEKEALGECADRCIPDQEVVECKACLAGTSVSGYCAGHSDHAGC